MFDLLMNGLLPMSVGLVILLLSYYTTWRDIQRQDNSRYLEEALPTLIKNTKNFRVFVSCGILVLVACVAVDLSVKRPYRDDAAVLLLASVYLLVILRKERMLYRAQQRRSSH